MNVQDKKNYNFLMEDDDWPRPPPPALPVVQVYHMIIQTKKPQRAKVKKPGWDELTETFLPDSRDFDIWKLDTSDFGGTSKLNQGM